MAAVGGRALLADADLGGFPVGIFHEAAKFIGDAEFERELAALIEHAEDDRELPLDPRILGTEKVRAHKAFLAFERCDANKWPGPEEVRRPRLPIFNECGASAFLKRAGFIALEAHTVKHSANSILNVLNSYIGQPEVPIRKLFSAIGCDKINPVLHIFGA